MKKFLTFLIALSLLVCYACTSKWNKNIITDSLFKEWVILSNDVIKGDFIRFYKDFNFVSFDTIHRNDSVYLYFRERGNYSFKGDSLFLNNYLYRLTFLSEDSINFQREINDDVEVHKFDLTLKSSNNFQPMEKFDFPPNKIDTLTNISYKHKMSLDGKRKEYICFERVYLCNSDTVYLRRVDIYPSGSFNKQKQIEEANKEFDEDYYMGEYGDQRWIRGIYTKEIESVYRDYATYRHSIYEFNKHMNGAAHGDEYSYYNTYKSYNEDDVVYYEDILNESYKKNIDELIADEIIEYLKKEVWGPEDYITLSKWKENFIDSNLDVTRQSNLGENGLIFNFSNGNNDDINLPHYYDIKVEIPYSKLKRYLKPPFDKLAK